MSPRWTLLLLSKDGLCQRGNFLVLPTVAKLGTSYQVVAQQFLDGYGKGVKMVKIAVVADIHGNLPALAAVWADIKWQGVDEILCLGDVVGYYPWPNEVIEFIRERAITLVQGNYDESVGEELPACGCDFPTAAAMLIGETSLQWTINTVTCENKRWLQDLPKNLRLQRATYDLLLVHGSPDRNNEYLTMDIPAAKLVNILAQEKSISCFVVIHMCLITGRLEPAT